MKYFLITALALISIMEIRAANKGQFYCILSFERIRKGQADGTEIFFWMAEADSVKSQGFKLSPLYLGSFSNTLLQSCAEGDTVNPYLVTEDDNYEFEKGYEEMLSDLSASILSKKEKIQTIKKAWGKDKETVTVYLTMVKGTFYDCQMTSFGYIDYQGKIFLPAGGIEYEVVNSEDAEIDLKAILKADYSYFFFVNTSTGGDMDKLPRW